MSTQNEQLRKILQERAENACMRFKQPARKPVVIEFSGTPRAGKTSTIRQVKSFLKRYGLNVKVVGEKASVCPVRDKRHPSFNIWTAATTLAEILELTQDPPLETDPDIVLLDRGIFDAVTWLSAMEDLERISSATRKATHEFLLAEDWRSKISGVILMTANPVDALKREKGFLPAPEEGVIVNNEFLVKMLEAALSNKEKFKHKFRIYHINTSAKGYNREKAVLEAAGYALGIIEEHLDEDIAFVPKSRVVDIFQGKSFLDEQEGQMLLSVAKSESQFEPRASVEANTELIQFLPVAVIRNRKGELLQMRRRERNSEDNLHEEIVLWAGGHVRKEDTYNGDLIMHCVRRELLEELRLSVEADELKFLGAVYHDIGGKTSQHAALVFEWQAETDDVQINLSEFEFFERVGSSLSGRFVDAHTLIQNKRKQFEPWTKTILQFLLKEGKSTERSLFD